MVDTASDVFIYLTRFRIAVCRTCRFAVWPRQARTHLTDHHREIPAKTRQRIADELGAWPEICHRLEDLRAPAGVPNPLPGLPLFTDGLQCQLDPRACCYIARSLGTLRQHWRQTHQWTAGPRGGLRNTQALQVSAQRRNDAYRSVWCQRFFIASGGTPYFEVVRPSQPPLAKESSLSQEAQEGGDGSLLDTVLADLAAREASGNAAYGRAQKPGCDQEVSPWLDLTRWVGYLSGHRLQDVAALAAAPDPVCEPALYELARSVDRLTEDAYQSICNDEVNVFDQARINSFLPQHRGATRPLMVKLQKSTWRKYTAVWKGLLCFVCRTASADCSVALEHRLTGPQAACLDIALQGAKVLSYAEGGERQGRGDGVEEGEGDEAARLACSSAVEEAADRLDRACLDLCVSLLDHDLKGSLYTSAIVGFLAVLGIDAAKDTLREAYSYSPMLSGFIKIAQMLVVQNAVLAARQSSGSYPGDFLEEMRLRFLVSTSRSPFAWASRLQAYAKKVRDCTTSLGYILWSADGQSVSYKDIQSLHVSGFQGFIRDQVTKAQEELEGILLVHPLEARSDLDVAFLMHRVTDNAAESQNSWNFLQHPANLQGTLPNRREWLLRRVLQTEWLLEEFFLPSSKAKRSKWDRKAATRYLGRVDSFLRRLLLLVHLTAGQPARGTELLSVRCINTLNGQHRSIFIEHGIVSIVTTYHKGYHVTGTTKIIHRYLPCEVGELLVYYLWLIRPFCQQLRLLALNSQEPESPFLWAYPSKKGGTSRPWDSSVLSQIMQQEFSTGLAIRMTIPIYRHLAIAMSRKHLKSQGFKRDYGIDESSFDRQASHNVWTAGYIYARGLEEAAGHVEERKAEYRRVSQEWHSFLGFVPAALPSLKRPLSDITNRPGQQAKQARIGGPDRRQQHQDVGGGWCRGEPKAPG